MDIDKIDKRLLQQLTDLNYYVQESVQRGFIYHEEFSVWHGICGNCTVATRTRLKDLTAQWPLSTGSRAYPIPASRNQLGQVDEARSKYRYSEPEEMWLNGEYAELRRELLAWLIKTLEESVNVKR